MIEKLKKIFKRNNSSKEVSEEALKEREKIEQQKIEAKNNYEEMIKENERKVEEVQLTKDEYNETIVYNKVNELKEERQNIEKSLMKQKQGRIKDIISVYLGQIDKRFANILFNNKIFGTKLLKIHEKLANKRYNNLSNYILKNSLIMFLIAVVCTLGLKFVPLLSGLLKIISVGNGIFAINTIIKTLSTYYNNKKFGGPLFGRFKNIFKGSHKENIETAGYAYRINKDIELAETIENDDVCEPERIAAMEEDLEKALAESLERQNVGTVKHNNPSHDRECQDIVREPDMVKKAPIPSRPDIRDYGNLGMVGIISTDDLGYIDAYSSIRKSSDNDIRVASYAKLASTYGKNPKKKNNERDINGLNSYARMLKMLSLYGRKIHDGTSTKEENAMYIELLYRLGKDFDDEYDITDFLSDEYDRYRKDQETYEESQKVYTKVK